VYRNKIFVIALFALVSLFITNVSAQANNPLAYFPFNGNANDESGNGNNGTVAGATLTEDRFGNDSSAYSFDGADDYIAYPTLWSSSPTALTMAAWFNIMPSIAGGKILYHGDNGEFQLEVSNDTVAAGAVHLGQSVSTGWHYTFGSIKPNNWNFIVSVWIQNEALKLYMNGVLVDSIEVIPGPLLDVGSTYLPSIASYSQTGGAYLNGIIDDIRIYNVALTQDQIDSLFYEGTTDIEDINLTIPEVFELYQNYPNPFNPTTNIEYSIPEASFVQLKAYDILGNEVATLVNEKQSAGTYRADFNGEGLSSGLYIAQLTAANYTQTIKMVLLR
jgi:hypothetical protein